MDAPKEFHKGLLGTSLKVLVPGPHPPAIVALPLIGVYAG